MEDYKNDDPLGLILGKANFLSEMKVPFEESFYIYGDKYDICVENGKILLRAELKLPDKNKHSYILSLAKELHEIQGKIRKVE